MAWDDAKIQRVANLVTILGFWDWVTREDLELGVDLGPAMEELKEMLKEELGD